MSGQGGKKSSRIRTPNKRLAGLNEPRPRSSLPPKPTPAETRRDDLPSDSIQANPSANTRGGSNGEARSQEHRSGNGSQQEEASSAMYQIIETTAGRPNPRVNRNQETPEPDVSKDEMIHGLKTEVCELKNERKRLLEHIDALSALRKEHETKIKSLETSSITLKSRTASRKKFRKSRSGSGRKQLQDICVFMQDRYSRVREQSTTLFIESIRPKNYSSEVIELLHMIFSRMNRLARFVANETNYMAFVDGGDVVLGTESDIDDSLHRIVYDPFAIGDKLEEESAQHEYSDDYVVLKIEKLTCDEKYILKSPALRIQETTFYTEDEQNIARCIADHGYFFMTIYSPETSRIGKSEFNDIIEQCTELHDRLLHCCRYFFRNKKKACKQNLVSQLGYLDEDGNIICDCISNITPEQDTNCLLYTSPSPRDRTRSRMPSSA